MRAVILALLIACAAQAETPSLHVPATDMPKIKARIDALTTLIGVEANEEKSISLRLTRGTSYYQLSKIDAANSKTLVGQAEEDLNFVATHTNGRLASDQKAYLDYLRGLVRADQGHADEAREFFRASLKENPNSSYAAGLSASLADDAYGSGRTDEATALYSKLASKPALKSNSADRAKILYRLANIEMQKNQDAQAQQNLLSVLTSTVKPQGDLRMLAIHDLATLAARARSSEVVTNAVNPKLSADEQKIFMNALLEQKMNQGGGSYEPLMAKMLKGEKDATERVRLLLSAYVKERQNGRSADVKFTGLQKEWSGLKANEKTQALEKLKPDLPNAFEDYISVLSKSYAEQQKKSPGSSQQGEQLESLLSLDDHDFGASLRSDQRDNLFSLWLDVRANQKDWTGVVALADRTTAMSKTVRIKSLQLKIVALEKLDPKDPRLVESLQKYVSDEKSPHWIEYAKRLGLLLVEQKDNDAAVSVWTKVDLEEKSEESYYRLQFARFQAAKYDEIVKDTRKNPSKRIQDILQESHLKMAQASKGENFDSYEANIKEVLRLNKDPSKRTLILKDYFAALTKKKLADKLKAQVLALSASERLSTSLQSYTRQVVIDAFAKGDYASVLLLTAPTQERPDDLAMTHLMAELANGMKPTTAWFAKVPQDKQNYVAGLIALAEPDIYDISFKPRMKDTATSKSLAYLAAKLRACEPPLRLTAQQTKRFGDLVPADQRADSDATTVAEKKLKQIKFVEVKTLTGAASAKMMKTLEQVRAARALVMSEVPKLDAKARLRVLRLAQTTEQSAASMVTSAPEPAGLNADQSKQYKSGIAQLAGEFAKQAGEFAKAGDSISRQVASEAAETKHLAVPKDLSRWPWPRKAASLRAQKPKLIAALIRLDMQKVSEPTADADYFATRAGFLLSEHPCSYTAEYVQDELSSANQTSLLKTWEGL